MQILPKSLFNSCIFSSKQGSNILCHFPVAWGGLRLAFLRPVKERNWELAGRKVEGPLDLNSCF